MNTVSDFNLSARCTYEKLQGIEPDLFSTAGGRDDDTRRVLARDIPAAKAAATQLISRHYISQCLFTFAEIGVADAIGGEELTPTAIAVKLEK